MRNQKTQGVIIKKRNIGEKDYVITLFTPLYGKIEAFARGARNMKSKFTGHLDLLNICEFVLYKSTNNFLVTECELTKNYDSLRNHLSKFYMGSKVSSLIFDFTTENENHEEIYNLLLETLEAIDQFDKDSIIIEAFKVKLFDHVGIMPNLYSLHETQFENLDLRLKKLLNFLLLKPYKEIIRLYVDKKDAASLKNMTTTLVDVGI